VAAASTGLVEYPVRLDAIGQGKLKRQSSTFEGHVHEGLQEFAALQA
jgi:hypothetical protein